MWLGEVTGQEDLHENDGRNAVFEFGVLGLVAPGAHTNERTDTTTDQRKPHQRALGNTPLVVLGLPLVESENQKRNNIDAHQIVKNHSCHNRSV